MTGQHEAERSAAANRLFDNCPTWLGGAVLVAAVTGYFARHSAPVYAAALVIAAVSLASILASLRFYNPWWSWIGWVVPFLLIGVVLAPLRIGVISVSTALFAYALAAAILFGVLLAARGRLRKWATGR